MSASQQPLFDDVAQVHGIIIIAMVAFLAYFAIGFGVMFGDTSSGWLGISSYLNFSDVTDEAKHASSFPFIHFFLYKMGFIWLGVLIIYSIIGRQLSTIRHVLIALLASSLLIPAFGHWTSSGEFIANNKGWLESLGFIDGSSNVAISTVAAWFAFIIAWKLSPRQEPVLKPELSDDRNSPGYSMRSVWLLWIGWIAMITGTRSITDESTATIILNLGLASAAAAITAYFHYAFFHASAMRIHHALGGSITGLVAIASCAESVSFLEAIVAGIIAGLLYNLSFWFVRQHFLRKTWHVRSSHLIAIHGAGGIWGALCIPLLGAEGNFSMPNTIQLMIQLQGVGIAILYSVVFAYLIFPIISFRQPKS